MISTEEYMEQFLNKKYRLEEVLEIEKASINNEKTGDNLKYRWVNSGKKIVYFSL